MKTTLPILLLAIYFLSCVWASKNQTGLFVQYNPICHGLFIEEKEKSYTFLEHRSFSDGSGELSDKWGVFAEHDSCGDVTILDTARYERAKGIQKIAPIGTHKQSYNEL